MKIILLIAIILMSLPAKSQRLKDSTALPNSQVKMLIKLVKQGEQARYDLNISQGKLLVIPQLLKTNDSLLVINYRYKNIIDSQGADAANLRRQKDMLLTQVRRVQDKLKIQKHKTKLALIGGAICAAFSGLLLIK